MNYKTFKLKKGQEVLIDDDDYDLVTKHGWQLNSTGYVRRSSVKTDGFNKRKTILLHRFLLGFPDCEIDHLNGNRLDNRRCNLKLSNRTKNIFNKKTKGYIDFCKKGNYYSPVIKILKTKINLGSFKQKRKAEIVLSKFIKYLNGDLNYYNYIIKHLNYRLSKPLNKQTLNSCLKTIEFFKNLDIKLLTYND